ncbi:MAG: hypothetical protein JNL21_22245 [Myxococcales bacterium]|nr:hypothetical protein [Myxococcales bacterium]
MYKSTLALVVALGASTAGCTATLRAPAPAVAVEAAYSPHYNNRHVVFYDDYGSPYYFAGGRVIYVPRSAPSYRSYVRHYHTYRPTNAGISAITRSTTKIGCAAARPFIGGREGTDPRPAADVDQALSSGRPARLRPP